MSDVEYFAGEAEQQHPPPTGAPPVDYETLDESVSASKRRRRGPRSLTSKLVVGVVSLVVLLVLIVGSGTYFALKSFLDNRLDQQVELTASQNPRFFSHCLQSATPVAPGQAECDYLPTTQEEWVGALNALNGQYFTFSTAGGPNEVRPLELNSTERRMVAGNNDALFTVRIDGQQLRVKAVRANDLVFVTGLSTGEVSRTLRQLVILELVIGGSAVVLALLATTFGVRFSLRRLRRVTVTAQEVAAELSPEGAGLERRVPDDEPETEVGQLATSFNTLLSAVETQFAARLESEQRMRQFMADASHELRTPLTSIRGYAELARMQRAVGGNNDDNLDRIESEGTRMSRLVEDLLLLARGDADGDDRPLERQLIDVPGLLHDAVSGARAAFPLRVITIDAEPGTHIIGDPDQLLRVVRNLVTNAAIHTHTDRPIRVHSHADRDGVTVQIIDGGPGLPTGEAARVFERFWRADKARTRARGGSGLGLSIVASIVRSHGGNARFDSSVEGGSTVTVWVPGVQPD
ncbi:MAG: HAMP domain-containing histidine kinase [Actinomycetota bacterium]|nr:HAMP domain-containing histidine kinase [Actinomycetota bacterium]